MEKINIKTLILGIAGILFIVGIFVYAKRSLPTAPIKQNDSQNEESFCFYRSDKTPRGLFDRAWIRLNIKGQNVTGEFYNLPAEKDSKIGAFTGTLGITNGEDEEKTARLWWDSLAEGTQVKEELIIKFGTDSASAGFGEMSQLGDAYVYKDKSQIFYAPAIKKIECSVLEEILAVEKFVRGNIKKIASKQAVLGGSWYVVSAVADTLTKSVAVSYEDGHIQNKETFSYAFDNQKVSIIKEKETNITKINQRIFNSGVHITPIKVISDSRCPVDVNCIWAGTVSVLVRLERENSKEEATLTLSTPEIFKDKKITMINVMPESDSKKPIADSDYRFEFSVLDAKK